MWIAFVEILKKIPWQAWLLSGLALSFYGWGVLQHHRGAAEVQKQWDDSISRGKVIVDTLRAGQNKVTTVIETKYKDRVQVIHEKGKTITKLVPQFIPADSCDLPGGFRLLHDAAVSGTIPSAAEGVDAAPVPVTTAATTITENYTTCKAAISDLEGMREWAQQQRQLYLELCKQPGVRCSADK